MAELTCAKQEYRNHFFQHIESSQGDNLTKAGLLSVVAAHVVTVEVVVLGRRAN